MAKASPEPSRKYTYLVVFGSLALLTLLSMKKEAVLEAHDKLKNSETVKRVFRKKAPDYDGLAEKFRQGKQAMEAHLRQIYGSYYDELFFEADNKVSITRRLFPQKISQQRLKDRLKLKVLESFDRPTKYVIVYGGHSAAAGHGNLYNETRSKYLEVGLQPIFDSIGVGLEVRNRAMGGTASFPEMSLCEEQIFGTDTDLLTWDYGMTDGAWNIWKVGFYWWRAALSASNPAVMATDPRDGRGRKQLAETYAEKGLTALNTDDQVLDEITNKLPDMFGMTQGQIDALPPHVKYFKCEGKLENGQPGCIDNKYSLGICDNRHGKASWHPGYRYQALVGYTLAMFIAEMLEEAVLDLQENKPDVQETIKELKSRIDSDLARFKASSFDDVLAPMAKVEELRATVANMFTGRTFCHTARLPSQIRYSGDLTETDKFGDESGGYDRGITQDRLSDYASDVIPLVSQAPPKDPTCDAIVAPDYKDYFFVSGIDKNSRRLVIPNDSSKKTYNFHAKRANFLVCSKVCDWGKCPEGMFNPPADQMVELTNFTITVNSVPATSAMFTFGCAFLKNQNGYVWEAQNEKFDFQIKMKDPESYWPIFTFVLVEIL